jgi:hypothetical protein
VVTRWQRTVGPGTLLEVRFEQARGEPVQGLVLEVDRGHLAWDEQGEEDRAIRLWADRVRTVVLRVTGRLPGATLSAWHVYLDHDELAGEVVRRSDRLDVEETADSALLRCGEEGDLTVRVGVRQRARASSA